MTAPVGGLGHGAVRFRKIGAVALENFEARETFDNLAMLPPAVCFSTGTEMLARYLRPDRAAGRQAENVERFPELAFAGGAVAGGGQADNVRGVRAQSRSVVVGIGAASAGGLRTGGRRRAHDVQLGRAPMGGHLAASGCGSIGRAHGFEQHVAGGNAQGEAQRAVAIVREKPIVAGLKHHPGGGLDAS